MRASSEPSRVGGERAFGEEPPVVRHTEQVDDARALGGKAANLAALERGGFPVPRWFCVTTAVFERALAPMRDSIDALLCDVSLDHHAALVAASEAIQASIRGVTIQSHDEAAIVQSVRDLFAADALLAVRSSAVGEDGAQSSFAGQMETFLYVRPHDVLARVRDSWASAFGERVLAYRLSQGGAALSLSSGNGAGVLVQAMVDSEASGVLFTANPRDGSDDFVVAAAFGLGEGVVADRVVSDTYFVARSGGEIRHEVAEKDARVVFDRAAGHGTTIEPLPHDKRSQPVLGDSEIRELVAIGARIEAHYGCPQDIEWTTAKGRLYILQARPITAGASQVPRGPETIFDNSNIVESYPGVTAPLTFSFARQVYEGVFSRTVESFMPIRWLRENPAGVFPNMLGYVNGRIYYNLTNWYRVYALLPNFDKVKPAFERMIGLSDPLSIVPERRDGLLGRLVKRPLNSFVFYSVVLWKVLTLRIAVPRYLKFFGRLYGALRDHDFHRDAAYDIVRAYREFEAATMARSAITTSNDFFVLRFYDSLVKLVKRYDLDPEATGLENDLLCGEKGMESVEPVRSILTLVCRVRDDAALRALFESSRDDAAVLAAIREEARFSEFSAAVERHLSLYGDRSLQELKLEVPSLRDEPHYIVAMLRNYLPTEISVEGLEARERAIRNAAEAQVRARIGWNPWRRLMFKLVVGYTRASVRFRENLRLGRSRSYGVVKRMLRALGKQYAAVGALDAADDIFFLTLDEALGFATGTCPTRDLRALVALRRSEFQQSVSEEVPPRVRVSGIVGASDFAKSGAAEAGANPGTGTALKGSGCSPGRVEARARVVLDPRADLKVKGEVLVTKMTDPGWVFLMISAAGIVVEKGSLLSHTAIIGRELGIPTVVGVADATTRIPDGAMVRVDGRTGLVEILEQP